MNRLLINECILFIVCVGLIVLYYRSRNNIEHMTDMNNEALSMLASIYNKKKLVVDELEVTGKSTLNGDVNIRGNNTIHGKTILNNHLHVKNGSRFEGGRHLFQDEEKAGWLRVGGAWGMPGIYADTKGKQVVVGSDSKIIFKGSDVHVEQNLSTHNLTTRHDANIKNLRVGNHFSIKKGDREHKPLLYDWGLFKVQHTKSTRDHHHGHRDFFHVNGGKGVQVWDSGGASSFLIRSRV